MQTGQALPLAPRIPSLRPFPLEIFLLIKRDIAPLDIRTHVCFYSTHPHIAGLYDSEQEAVAFWRRLCWYNGIGALGEDNLRDPHCWRKIAIEAVEEDGFCQHPRCGEALLAYNRRRMARAAECIRPLTVFSNWNDEFYDGTDSDSDDENNDTGMDVDGEDDPDGTDDDEDDEPPRLFAHRNLLHLAFRTEGYHDVLEDAQVKADTEGGNGYGGSLFLQDHLLMQRSFATDIPVNRFCLGPLGLHDFTQEKSKRRTGVTVLDVVTTICHDLDIPLTRGEQKELVNMLDRGFSGVLTANDVYGRRFHTLRAVLAECHIREFHFDGTLINGAPLFLPTIAEN